MTAVTNMDKT